jgi:hypothetical protein
MCWTVHLRVVLDILQMGFILDILQLRIVLDASQLRVVLDNRQLKVVLWLGVVIDTSQLSIVLRLCTTEFYRYSAAEDCSLDILQLRAVMETWRLWVDLDTLHKRIVMDNLRCTRHYLAQGCTRYSAAKDCNGQPITEG